MGWNNYTATNSYQGGANPVDSILVSDTYESDFVYQRDSAGNATAEFSVSYTSPPVDLYYRLLDAEDDSIVIDWTAFETVPVEGSGTTTLSITRASSITYYKAEVRLGTNGPVSTQSYAWAVGIKVAFIGQSLIEHLGAQDQSGTPEHVRKFTVDNGFFISTVGAGQAECAKRLVEIHNCIVAICNTAVGDTVLTQEAAATGNRGSNYWNNPNSALWQNTLTALDRFAPDGRVEFVTWMQGGSDATQGVDYGIYENDLREFLSRVRGAFLYKDGTQTAPIVMGTLGRSGSSTDANRQGIREAISSVIEDDPTLLPIPIYPYATDDRTHPNDAGDIAIGLSIANVSNGETAPRFSSNSIDSNVITLTYDQDLLTSDTSYSTEGVRVEVNGSSVGVSSFTRSGAGQAEITLDETPSDISDISVYVCYGSGTGSSLLTYPKSASNGLFTIPVISKNNDFSASANQPPVANAGPNQSVSSGATVQLDATQSTAGSHPIASYEWAQTAGDTVTLVNSTTASPSFISPSENEAQTITFNVVAIDTEGTRSAAKTVSIAVAAFNFDGSILELIDSVAFELITDGNLMIYPGRANREIIKLRPSSELGLVVDDEGCIDFEAAANTISKLEVIIYNTSEKARIDSESLAIVFEGSEAHCRFGDFQPKSAREPFDVAVVLYIEGDGRGVVVYSTSEALSTQGASPISAYVQSSLGV